MTFDVAVVGVGPGPDISISGRTHSWGYRHAEAYLERDDCRLVACADLEQSYATSFAETFDITPEGVFTAHREMLESVNPDVVSVCTPIAAHEPVVVDCANAGVTAVHCEKPMAATWATARGMAHMCELRGTQLTFGHQRRFAPPFLTAKQLLDDGAIGTLERIEISWGNFFDNGTHVVDLAGMFVDEARAEWVIGQIDYTIDHVRYGVPTADQAFMTWRYENGVQAVLATGDDVDLSGGPFDFYDCWHRLIGSEGVIEIGRLDGPALRIREDGSEWNVVDVEQNFEGSVAAGVGDALDALSGDRTSVLDARHALNTTEILFAGHESSRRRRRIELPLTGVYDHPLVTMLEEGDIVPERGDDRPPHPSEQ